MSNKGSGKKQESVSHLASSIRIHPFFHSNNIPVEGNDWKGRLQFLFARGIREFERILGARESKVLNLGFTPRKAEVEILKDRGMLEDEIFVKKRHYFIVQSGSTRLKYAPW